MNVRIDNVRTAEHAAHLRRLAATWQAELRQLGRRPRARRSRLPLPPSALAPWQDRQTAIAGALALACSIEAASRQAGAA